MKDKQKKTKRFQFHTLKSSLEKSQTTTNEQGNSTSSALDLTCAISKK